MTSQGIKGTKSNSVLTPIFIISALITAFFSILSMINPTKLSEVLTEIQTIFAIEYGWFAMLIPSICVVILVALGFSKKYGHIVIGGQDAKPDYALFSWIGMLFTASIGVGIIYFGINEPLYAYFLDPASTTASSAMEAARVAMGTSIYHWGISIWGIFSIAGIVMAYFVYKHNSRYLPGDILLHSFPDKKWTSPVSKFMNVLACVCSAMTIAATMGLGAVQITTGLSKIFGLSEGLITVLPYIVLAILLGMCLAASTTKTVGKGMNIIGDWNVYMAIALLVFAMIFGPTRYIFEQIVQTFGSLISDFIPRNFNLFIFAEDPTYSTIWDVSTIMWWVAWTPFMGVFIASISKGRTIKQFVTATLTIPVAFMILWHCTFGAVALLDTIQGTGEIGNYAMTGPDMTFFAFLKTLPLPQITTIFTVILLIFFLATTITSAALSLSRMTDKDGKEAKPIRSAVWCILMASIALTGIFAATKGGNEALNAIRALATTMAYPYLFFLILIITAFLKKIIMDEKENPTINPNDPKHEVKELRKLVSSLQSDINTARSLPENIKGEN